MSTDHETTRIVRSWLQEGATTVPDRVLDEVFDQLPTTRQRRSARPAPRLARLTDGLRGLAALAAAVVIAVVALGPLGGFGALTATPSRTPSPTPTPSENRRPTSPTPPPVPEVSLVPGADFISPPPLAADVLKAGTYDVVPAGAADFNGFTGSIEFTLPAGWSGWADIAEAIGAQREGDRAPRGMAISFWTVENVFADPCTHTLMRTAPGPEVADLALALSSITGTAATAPRPVTVDGYDALYTEFRVTTDYMAECSGLFYLWTAGQDRLRWAHGTGELDRNWVFDLAGQADPDDRHIAGRRDAGRPGNAANDRRISPHQPRALMSGNPGA